MDDYNLRGVIDQFGAATFERMPVQPDRTSHFLIARYAVPFAQVLRSSGCAKSNDCTYM
jgi:hypothetical protein